MKRDVIFDVNEALKKYRFENAFMTSHLGVDHKLVDFLSSVQGRSRKKDLDSVTCDQKLL